MEIILNGMNPQDAKFLDNDGRDITDELKITKFKIEMSAKEPTKVEMTCYIDKMHLVDLDVTAITPVIESEREMNTEEYLEGFRQLDNGSWECKFCKMILTYEPDSMYPCCSESLQAAHTTL